MDFRDGQSKRKALSSCLILGLVLGVLATGCDGSTEASVEEHLKRAQDLLKAADFRGSVVELKNVLQSAPDNADARLILSQVYAEVGDGVSAEKEILRARELGLKGIEVTKALGRAYILTGKFKQVLEAFPVEAGEPASRRSAIFLLRGDAFYGLGKNVEAETAYDNAIDAYRKDINEERPHLKLTEPPEYVAAIVGKTMVSIRRRNWPEADKRLNRALEIAPGNPEALAAKGEITFKQEDPAASEKAYLAAFKAKPYDLEFQIGIARAQIALKKFDEAIVNLGAVRKHFPDHIITNQYRALAALQSGDSETAKQFADKILKVAPDYIPAHLIAGAANYGLGNYEQANNFLSRYVTRVPDNHQARKLLGMTQLRLRRATAALATLQPLSKNLPDDLQALNLIAAAAVGAGDLTTASAYYQKAVVINPDDSEARLKLALTDIQRGNRSEGMRDLKLSIERTPKFLKSQYILMDIYLRERAFNKAIEIARSLQNGDPENPAPHIGEGLALSGKKAWKDAITAFEHALKISPNHIGASYGLADIFLQTSEPEKARRVYADILESKSGHLPTLMRWIGLETKAGDKKQVDILIARALKSNPAAVAPRLLAAQALLDEGQPIRAIASLSDLIQKKPDNPGLLQITGRAQIAAKKAGEAVRTLERLVKTVPNSPGAHFLLGKAYSMLGNQDRAITELGMAITLQPKFLRASVARVRALALKDKAEPAFEALRKLKLEFPGNRDVLSLEAWIAVRHGHFDKAIPILSRLLKENPDEDIAIQLSAALWNADKKNDAVAILESWTQSHAKSIAARMELANLYALWDKNNDAIRIWRDVIHRAPLQWVALNNLANALSDFNPTEAIAFAERAYKRAPDFPPIPITLAELLLKTDSQASRVIKILRPITAAFPKHNEAQLLLAKALSKTGDRDVAKNILKKIMTRNPGDTIRRQVESLLKTLNK